MNDIQMKAQRIRVFPFFCFVCVFLFSSFLYIKMGVSSVYASYACNAGCGQDPQNCTGDAFGNAHWCSGTYGNVCRNPSCPAKTNCTCLTCGQACSGVDQCEYGLNCSANICTASAPSCTEAHPAVTITKTTTDPVLITVTGVADATSVNIYAWSGNLQDDMVMYPGSNQGGGVWTASIILGNHPREVGAPHVIRVHVYKFNCTYPSVNSTTWCDSADFLIDTDPPTCSISGSTSAVVGNSVSYTADATDENLNNVRLNRSPNVPTPSWMPTPFCDNTGDCTASVIFPSAGEYYVKCRATDSAGNKCDGSPWGCRTPRRGRRRPVSPGRH